MGLVCMIYLVVPWFSSQHHIHPLGYCHEFVFFPFLLSLHSHSHSMTFESISNDMIFIDIPTLHCNSWYLYFPCYIFFFYSLLLSFSFYFVNIVCMCFVPLNPVEFLCKNIPSNVSTAPIVILFSRFFFFVFFLIKYTSKYLIKCIQRFRIHLLNRQKMSRREFHLNADFFVASIVFFASILSFLN